MYPPALFPKRGKGSDRGSLRACLLVMSAALPMLLMFGCDSSNPVEATMDDRASTSFSETRTFGITSTTIQVPEPAERLDRTGEFFPPDPIHRFKSPRHETEPAGLWLRRLAAAETWDVALYRAAMAEMAIKRLPEDAQRVFFPRLVRTLELVSPLSDLVTPTPKPSRADVDDFVGVDYSAVHTICFVGFDLSSILDAFPDDAMTTFVVSPYWRQDCSDAGQVRVEPITTLFNHYHLLYEDPDINCIDLDNGMYGREIDGECEALSDFAAEPRYLGTMGGEEIIRIRTHDQSTGTPIPFDLISFANVGDEPVKLRYKNDSGLWFQYNSLGGHTNWGVSVFDAVEVLITHAGTSLDCGIDQEAGAPGGCPMEGTPFHVDEFVVGLD